MAHRSEERRDRPLEGGHQPLDPGRIGCDAFAEIKSGIEAGECNHALRPLHRRGQRQPDASDNAVGAPGVENIVNRFALVPHDSRLRFHGHYLECTHGVEVAQATMRHRANSA